ncbi:MAG: MBOAT family O-acyltransferase [Planctomycetota bacterium]
MLFNSLTFVVFFGVVMLLHHLPLSWRLRKTNLVLASYLFYAAWNPLFVPLLLGATLVSWFAAGLTVRGDGGPSRRAPLVLSIAASLGVLAYFKYRLLLAESSAALLGLVGVEFRPAAASIVVPVGVSFYLFQSMSYTVDVYRGTLRPWPSFLDYALYVGFFPQLVAGPIVRAGVFLPQCREPKRASPDQLGWGASLLVLGLFEKVVLADHLLAPVADQVFDAGEAVGFAEAWTGVFAFSGQILFDFSGYSTCAIGAAMCLGFVLPENFRSPYAAMGFSDFWRRWHISLSTWLRDYLYIPLGGSRKGAFLTFVALSATMLLGGLWHGAAWGFVLWGGVHGLLLCAERVVKAAWGHRPAPRGLVPRLALGLGTFVLVSIAWVFFRADGLSRAASILGAMFRGGTGDMGLRWHQYLRVPAITGLLVAAHWVLREKGLECKVARVPWGVRAVALGALLTGLVIAGGDDRAFIYFQF